MPRDGNDEQKAKENQWKNKDEIYLFHLQKFLDLTENVKDEALRKEIVAQMLKCDKRVTQLAEEMFDKLQKEEK